MRLVICTSNLMEGTVCFITWALVLSTVCDISSARHGPRRNYRNRHKIHTSNTRDYVNLHMAEVAEMTEATHGRDLRTSIATSRAYMKRMQSSDCDPNDIYRNIDGSCNNLYNPMWGTPMRKQLRLVRASYDDGISKPRLFRGRQEALPSARVVSQACFPHDSTDTLDTTLSNMAMQWGQFLDHDITGTPESNKTKDCCEEMLADGMHPDYSNNGDCFPIFIVPGDRHFTRSCMEFRRSMPAEQNEQREQLNIITAYIDASQIYGSSPQELVETRLFVNGLLRKGENNILPINTTIKRPCVTSDIGSCFFSGDVRVNEFPALTSMHAVFHREHNLIARELANINPHWDDESLFQETRKIMAAYMQIITYEEFLPVIFGAAGMRRYGLNAPYQYTPGVNPEIINSFSTAAYRFGHSMIDSVIKTMRNPQQKIDDIFFKPSFNSNGNGSGLNFLIEGLISAPCQRNDKFFSAGVSDNLFKDVSSPGISFDLPARNIQRGRDHGLPPYLSYKRFAEQYYKRPGSQNSNRSGYISRLAGRFNRRRGSNVFNRGGFANRRHTYRGRRASLPARRTLSFQCRQAYNNKVEDVDLFVGGLHEEPVDGGVLGQTFAAILGVQFQRLKNSDRFWYETTNTAIGFTPEQLAELRKVSLARILCDNTAVPHIQKDVFRIPGPGNPVTLCTGQEIPRIDLTKWADQPIVINK